MAALASIAAGPSLVGAQEFPSLSGAVQSGGGEIWSGGDPAGAVVGPGLASEYLAPIPEAEGAAFSGALADGECSSCNGAGGGLGGFYNRCGCETPLFPYFTGPGNCDNWCVGPHWNVEVDGMFVHREDAEWGAAGITPAGVVDQFDYGPGVRLFATGYNYSNYGVQIGYEGVNDFHSTAFTAADSITYESNLNSLEVNLLRRTRVPLKVFAGARYVEIDEGYDATVTTVGPTFGNTDGTFIENRLMGFQIGALRDAWQLNRWITIEPYGNVGAYFNDFKRENIDVAFTTGAYTVGKQEFSEIAYLGEAGVTSVLRINACLALRGGYQVMAFHGVANALETSLLANGGFDPDTLIYHGARFGIEYQR
jgi:hypothetical protein